MASCGHDPPHDALRLHRAAALAGARSAGRRWPAPPARPRWDRPGRVGGDGTHRPAYSGASNATPARPTCTARCTSASLSGAPGASAVSAALAATDVLALEIPIPPTRHRPASCGRRAAASARRSYCASRPPGRRQLRAPPGSLRRHAGHAAGADAVGAGGRAGSAWTRRTGFCSPPRACKDANRVVAWRSVAAAARAAQRPEWGTRARRRLGRYSSGEIQLALLARAWEQATCRRSATRPGGATARNPEEVPR